MPNNKPRSQYKRKRSGFMVKDLKKRTELLTVDVVKENHMAASLSVSSNTGYTDFIFSARNDKSSDNASKIKTENSRLIYDEVQEDIYQAHIKRLMKINLVAFSTTQ